MRRMALIAGVAACALGSPLGIGTAHADRQEFLDFIHSRGVPPSYFATPGADVSNTMAANMVCDVFRNGGSAADVPFLGFQQDAYRDAIIEGAQRFMCPDAL